MQERHREAYESLAASALSETSDAYLLDLHGLHADEATDCLERTLASLRGRDRAAAGSGHHGVRGSASAKAWLDVVTGTGHHSHDGHSKLGPACVAFLTQARESFEERSVDRRGGCLRIRL